MVNGSKKTAVVEVKLTNDSLSDDCHLFLLTPKVLLAHSRPTITITSVQPIPFHPRQCCCLNICSYIDWRRLFSLGLQIKGSSNFWYLLTHCEIFQPMRVLRLVKHWLIELKNISICQCNQYDCKYWDGSGSAHTSFLAGVNFYRFNAKIWQFTV